MEVWSQTLSLIPAASLNRNCFPADQVPDCCCSFTRLSLLILRHDAFVYKIDFWELHNRLIKKCCCRANEIAQQVNVLVTKPNDPSFNPGTHRVEGQKWLLQVVLWTPYSHCDTGTPLPYWDKRNMWNKNAKIMLQCLKKADGFCIRLRS